MLPWHTILSLSFHVLVSLGGGAPKKCPVNVKGLQVGGMEVLNPVHLPGLSQDPASPLTLVSTGWLQRRNYYKSPWEMKPA